MHYENNDRFKFFLLLLGSYNLRATIDGHTRIQNKIGSCIDNIFTNFEGNIDSEILQNSIFDHTAQKVSFNLHNDNITKCPFKEYLMMIVSRNSFII